jgi:hypothetical protein
VASGLLLVESQFFRSLGKERERSQKLEWQGQAPQHDDITLIVVKVK